MSDRDLIEAMTRVPVSEKEEIATQRKDKSKCNNVGFQRSVDRRKGIQNLKVQLSESYYLSLKLWQNRFLICKLNRIIFKVYMRKVIRTKLTTVQIVLWLDVTIVISVIWKKIKEKNQGKSNWLLMRGSQ